MRVGPEWKYRVKIDNPNWPEAQDWCEKYIGKFDKDWYKLGIDPLLSLIEDDYSTTWYFKREQDLTMFILRWS